MNVERETAGNQEGKEVGFSVARLQRTGNGGIATADLDSISSIRNNKLSIDEIKHHSVVDRRRGLGSRQHSIRHFFVGSCGRDGKELPKA